MQLNVSLSGEQYAHIPSLSLNQENLSLGNVVDQHSHDGEDAHSQCQSDVDAHENSTTNEADNELLFLEPEFLPDPNLASLIYPDNQLEFHPLHCQCLKVKLATSFMPTNQSDLITQSRTNPTTHKKQILSFVQQLCCLTILCALTLRCTHIQSKLFTHYPDSLSLLDAFASLQHHHFKLSSSYISLSNFSLGGLYICNHQ